jgi:hypothetical protein
MRLSNIALINGWNAMPLARRLAILAESVIEHQRAQAAITSLIALIAIMASHLDSEARAAIARQLRAEADGLVPPLERLH